MKTLRKYIDAVQAHLMLRRLLRPLRGELARVDKMLAYNMVSTEVNKVFKRYAVYDETYWIVWAATGGVELPAFELDPSGDYHFEGIGRCRISWTRPELLKKTSQWQSAGASAPREDVHA